MDQPLLIMPKGWTPASRSREWRDDRGWHRVTVRTDDATGKTAGNNYGNSYEYLRPDGIQHARVRPPTVKYTLRASDFGLSVEEMRAVVALKFSTPRPSGLVT